MTLAENISIGRKSIIAARQRGIDTSGLTVKQGGKTFRWRGRYLPNMNDRETNDKKAKDWDVLELFYKMDRVEGPKVHSLKLGNGI